MIELVCDGGGGRLDAWLAGRLEAYSRSHIQKLIDGGFVTVNGVVQIKKYALRTGDAVAIDVPRAPAPGAAPFETAPHGAAAQDIALNIIYEDDYIIIVDKPKGMVVHPGNGNPDGTLANALAYHCAGALSDVNGLYRPGIVHRLDKDTSGLIAAAKTNAAHYKLAAEFKERRVRKIYNAIVRGRVANDTGRIEMPIGRHKTDRKRMSALQEGGREATTLFKVVKRLPGDYTWLELELLTGRTHQIRVHLAQIGHPVAGDPLYGKPSGGKPSDGKPFDGKNKYAAYEAPGGAVLPEGQLLHSSYLEFAHPATGERVKFTSPLPYYFPV